MLLPQLAGIAAIILLSLGTKPSSAGARGPIPIGTSSRTPFYNSSLTNPTFRGTQPGTSTTGGSTSIPATGTGSRVNTTHRTGTGSTTNQGVGSTTDSVGTTTSSTIPPSSNNPISTNPSSTTTLPPISGFPVFTVPTVTVTAGPEQTSEAAKVIPIFLLLRERREWLEDADHKQDYIDYVEQSRNDIAGLFGMFDVQPPPRRECSQTSLKRSLISGVLDLFKSAADLMSCAVAVVSSLDTVVKGINPSTQTVELLTDTLKDISDELQKEDDDQKSTQSGTTTTSSTSSSYSSSCTTTITATYESVLCTVTGTVNRRQDKGCTTKVYSTVTGCRATGATETTTSTASSLPTPFCGSTTCGGNLCEKGRKSDLWKRVPLRVSDPPPGVWAGLENYNSPQDFMAGEVNLAFADLTFEQAVYLPDHGTSSSKTLAFINNVRSLAVQGLHGCTSVIAVSQKGAWASHIWEDPTFTDFLGDPKRSKDQQLAIFHQNAIMALEKGSDAVFHVFGLGELRNGPQPVAQQPETHLFDDDTDPHVYIFAPYERVLDTNDPNYNNENPVGLRAAWDAHDDDPDRADNPGPSFNAQILDTLVGIFGNSAKIETVLYAPRVDADGKDPTSSSHRGKVLVQYQPSANCRDKARWRIWFEGRDVAGRQAEWDPLPYQQYVPPPAIQGRQATLGAPAACPLRSVPSSSSTSAPTSTTIPTSAPPTSATTAAATATSAPPTSAPAQPTTTSTSTPTPPPEPSTPLTVQPVVCNNEAELPGHADVNGDAQALMAGEFCESDPDRPANIGAGPRPFEATKQDANGVRYYFSVGWVQGCVTTAIGGQSFGKPVGEGGPTCVEIMKANYKNCNNGGVGGRTQAGCLEYTFIGGQ